jgi:two-component SAPR family response regulator
LEILLVDDDETLRQSLQLLLQAEGYSIAVASSGEEALEQARLRYFDLVLCDVRMPGIDGIETIKQLKDSISDAHFVVMTGYASEDAPVQALRLGVDDYLHKPFDIPIFLEKLRALARRRKLAAQKSSLNLWRFVDSLKEHFPAHALRSEPVEEKGQEWGQRLSLSQDSMEALRLAAWLHPLSQGLKEAAQAESSDSESDEPTDRIAQILSNMATPSTDDKVADILRAAVAVATGASVPTDIHTELQSVLEDLSVTCEDDEDESESESSHPLKVTTLGRFEVKINNQIVDRKAWQSANARWIFVYLLSRRGQSVPEDRLAELFWPGSPTKKAHRALVSSVHRARKALQDPELLVRYDKSYGISRDCEFWLDSDQLLSHYKEGTRNFYQGNTDQAITALEKALALYQGPFLPNCHDVWCHRIRADIRMKTVDAAEKVAQLLLDSDPVRSEAWCRKAISMESTSEPAWSTLFRALARQGRRAEVETAYRQCVDTLEEELQLNPGASLRQSYEESLN